jgi:hypothetical protein
MPDDYASRPALLAVRGADVVRCIHPASPWPQMVLSTTKLGGKQAVSGTAESVFF